jgi:transcriptional regulator with XRE-family HTH domain
MVQQLCGEQTYQLGDHIRKWRNLRNIKQSDMANRLGIKNSAMSNIENNKAGISRSRLEEIAAMLQIEVQWLFIDPVDLIQLPSNYTGISAFKS